MFRGRWKRRRLQMFRGRWKRRRLQMFRDKGGNVERLNGVVRFVWRLGLVKVFLRILIRTAL